MTPVLPATQRCAKTRPLPAVPDAVMPKLPRGPKAWLKVVTQWEEPDPRTGLALMNWPETWYKGDMRLINGVKYGQRRAIALEYIRSVIHVVWRATTETCRAV